MHLTLLWMALAAAASPDAVVARYRDGVVTESEYRDRLRATPGWLRCGAAMCARDELTALIERRLLIAEARRLGLVDAAGRPEIAERLGVRKLIAREPVKPGDPERHAAFNRVKSRLSKAAGITFAPDSALLAISEHAQASPSADSWGEPPPAGELDLTSADGEDLSCVIQIDPKTRTYGGDCGGVNSLADGLMPSLRLYLEMFHSGTVPSFVEHYIFDDVVTPHLSAGVMSKVWADHRDEIYTTPPEGIDQVVRCDLQIAGAGGTLQKSEAQAVLDWVRPALRHCLINSYWIGRVRPAQVHARLLLDYAGGRASPLGVNLLSGASDMSPHCANVFTWQPLHGDGRLEIAVDFAGFPSRDLSKLR